MDLSDIGQDIIKAAPLLGSLLGGPAGGAVGTLLAAKFGGSPNNVDDLVKKMNDDPQRDIKLAEIESNNEIQLQNLIITNENNIMINQTAQLKIQADNVASARDMNQKNKKLSDETIKILLVIFTFLVIAACLTGIFKKLITTDIIPVITMILGVFLSEVKNYNGFYFGDSIGSRNKDELLAQQQKDSS